MSKVAERLPEPAFNAAELGVLAHLYRGEMYRSKIWRTRLDTTTNWAVAVTGIALPLGNYHNMAEEGRLEAEYIHRADLSGAVALLHATVIAAPAADRAPARQRLENLAREHGERLRASAGGLA